MSCKAAFVHQNRQIHNFSLNFRISISGSRHTRPPQLVVSQSSSRNLKFKRESVSTANIGCKLRNKVTFGDVWVNIVEIFQMIDFIEQRVQRRHNLIQMRDAQKCEQHLENGQPSSPSGELATAHAGPRGSMTSFRRTGSAASLTGPCVALLNGL